MKLLANSLTSSAVACAALAAAPSAQSDGGCALPGMDVHPSAHPFGPVNPDDGALDVIDVQSNTPLDFEFSLAGLDHSKSLAIAPSYLTLAAYSAAPAEVPLVLNPCASLQLPLNANLVVVPSASLSATAQVNLAGPPGSFADLYMQAVSLELADPALAPEISDLARVRFHQGPTVPDPTTDKEYNCYYWGYYVWNLGDEVGSVEGRIYWPSICDDGSQDPPGPLPLVLLIHGDGHAYTDYGYLMTHLAKNGYIAATINGGQGLSNVERAKRIRTYLSFIRNNWGYKSFVQNNIALIGHSRGGEAVLTAARKLNNDWGYDHNINAVISLAPTDNDEDGGTEGLESLSGLDSDSLLVIYGSMDEDVAGYCTDGTAIDCGAIPTGPQATGFAIYDRAGGEYSTDGIYIASDAIEKSMLFVQRADHNRWREPCTDPGLVFNPPLDCAEHHDTLKAYANAFLRWQLSGQTSYKPFFTGEWTPTTVADHEIDLFTQYSDSVGRRVIDNFESGAWNVATLGSVTKELQVTVVKKGTLFDHGNFTSPHDTNGMVLRWSTSPFLVEPWIRWTIPAGSGMFTGPYRDFSGFSALSLRVGQMDDSTYNTPGEPQNFFVRLRDGSGTYSPKVWVNAFTDLSYPHQAHIVSPLAQPKSTAKSSLRTARIPLGYFSGINLKDVVDVELVFGDNDHLQGEILLDSLELVP